MGFLEGLTLIFIVLKLMGVVAWSWFVVLLPVIVAVGCYILWFAFVMLLALGTGKSIKKRRKKK